MKTTTAVASRDDFRHLDGQIDTAAAPLARSPDRLRGSGRSCSFRSFQTRGSFSGRACSGPRSVSPDGMPAAMASAMRSGSRGRRTAPCRSGSSGSGRGRSSGSISTTRLAVAVFAAFWQTLAPHPWWRWSILGSALILFTTYFQVEVSVAINDWYGPFYDLIQAALGKTRTGDAGGILRLDRRFPRHRAGGGRRRRAVAVLRQPLRLPLAQRDERLLHELLAAAARHRGRLAARAGRHHAVLHAPPRASASACSIRS